MQMLTLTGEKVSRVQTKKKSYKFKNIHINLPSQVYVRNSKSLVGIYMMLQLKAHPVANASGSMRPLPVRKLLTR